MLPRILTPPKDDATYFAHLQAGARFLAAEADSRDERDEHLRMALRYGRLRAEALRAAR